MTINGLAVAFVVGWKAWPKAMKELSTCSPENGVVTKGTLPAIGFGLRWLAPLMVAGIGAGRGLKREEVQPLTAPYDGLPAILSSRESFSTMSRQLFL